MKAESVNLSANGVYCKIERPIPEMTRLKMVIVLPADGQKSAEMGLIECKGVIVRTNENHNSADPGKGNRMAVFFEEIDSEQQNRLIEPIESHLADRIPD